MTRKIFTIDPENPKDDYERGFLDALDEEGPEILKTGEKQGYDAAIKELEEARKEAWDQGYEAGYQQAAVAEAEKLYEEGYKKGCQAVTEALSKGYN